MATRRVAHLLVVLAACATVLVAPTSAQTEAPESLPANITASCATASAQRLESPSSVDIADAIRAALPCDGGWTVEFTAGSYSGPMHCDVAWPSNTDLHLVATNGLVEIDCQNSIVQWSYDYADKERVPRVFEIGADAGSGWHMTRAQSFVRIGMQLIAGLRVAISHVVFTCTIAPGPSAVVVRTPTGLSRAGTTLEIYNCSFTYTQAFAIAVMGSVNLTVTSSSFASFSRGSIFCVSDMPTHALLDLVDAWPDDGPALNTSVTCIRCTLRVAGRECNCTLPVATMPPLGNDFYDTCQVLPPATSAPSTLPPPPTPVPLQTRLVVLALVGSAIICSGTAALFVAAVWRKRVHKAVLASTTADSLPHSSSDLVPLQHQSHGTDFMDM